MALNALTLAVTKGIVGQPFLSAVNGLTTGRVEVLNDATPGFSYVNGTVFHPSLPYEDVVVALREYEPGVGSGFRDSRIAIAAARDSVLRAAYVGGSTPTPTPTPTPTAGTSVSRYSFAGTNMRIPTNNRSVGTTNLYHVAQFIWGSPAYATNNIRFFLPNFWETNTAFVANSNAITIEALGIDIGGTVYTASSGKLVASDGSLSDVTFPATIPAGASGIWVDAINVPGGIAANTVYKGRVAYNAPSNGVVPTQVKAVSLGQGSQGGTTTQAALVSAANYSANLSTANTHSDIYLPTLCVATGGDGREALIVIGDSIGYGANESGSTTTWSTRGEFGYVSRGLDDNSTTKRIAHANIACPGHGPANWQTATYWSLIRFAIQAVNTMHGAFPFDRILSQHGTNSIGTSGFNAMMQNYWTTLATELGNKPITQIAMLPYPASTDGYATLANQTPAANNGIGQNRWNFNDALAAGTFSPQVQDFFEPWRKVSYDLTTNRDKLRIPGMGDLTYNTTVASDYSGSGTISLTAQPTIGMTLSFGPGTFTAFVSAVTGTGPYTATIAPVGGSLTAVTAGTSVREILHDGGGLHPSATTHRDRLTPSVIEWKTARGWV